MRPISLFDRACLQRRRKVCTACHHGGDWGGESPSHRSATSLFLCKPSRESHKNYSIAKCLVSWGRETFFPQISRRRGFDINDPVNDISTCVHMISPRSPKPQPRQFDDTAYFFGVTIHLHVAAFKMLVSVRSSDLTFKMH